jgi:hypothetical protein
LAEGDSKATNLAIDGRGHENEHSTLLADDKSTGVIAQRSGIIELLIACYDRVFIKAASKGLAISLAGQGDACIGTYL